MYSTMADPPHFSLFQQKFRTGDKPFLVTVSLLLSFCLSYCLCHRQELVPFCFILQTLDADFLMNHTKVLLKSDASDKVWKVKLDGGRLSEGWEEFACDQKFRDGDVLVFKHHGDEVFHVAVVSPSVSGDIRNASSSQVITEDTYIDVDDVDDDDYGQDDEDDDDDDDEGEDNIGKVFHEVLHNLFFFF